MSNARIRRKHLLKHRHDEIIGRHYDGNIEGETLCQCADGELRPFKWIVTRDGRYFAFYGSVTGRYPSLDRVRHDLTRETVYRDLPAIRARYGL